MCGRAAVRILLPPSSSGEHTARPLIGGNQQEERARGRELCQVPCRPANSYNPAAAARCPLGLTRILRPCLCSRIYRCGGIRTNLRWLLPHLKNHSLQIIRKYSAEGIGVRMAAYKLVLIRHGESCWNQENRFCGWFDADLSETGEQEAKRGGQALKGTR